FKRERKERHAKANLLGPLRSRAEESQRVCRDRKLLEKMVIDHGVDIEAHLICMFDLPENLPGHLRMGFSRGRLHFGVDSESHNSAPHTQINRLVQSPRPSKTGYGNGAKT